VPRHTPLTPALYDYLVRVSVREPEVLARLREETRTLPWAGMQIGPDQGQFMRFVVESIGARRAIEVGVFTGYSSISVALGLPDDGELVACDVSDDWTRIARRYWEEAGVAHKIRLHLRPAVETLDALLADGREGEFDFAFVDADKEAYDAYYERCLRLLRPGGVAAFDNVLWGGSVADPASTDADTLALRALNEKLRDDARVSITMLSIGDGLTLARKL
jgi:caffeoyl-CoA O-methyltransferase